MQEITKEGKTVEEAVKKALAELGVTRDKVEIEIEVLEEEEKGLFGMEGAGKARVRVKLKENST